MLLLLTCPRPKKETNKFMVLCRDLKTKNCLLNAAGEAKIADVGC